MSSQETVCLGFNYLTSPVALRERLTCSLPHFRQATPDPARWAHVHEAVLLATCNRWEMYACPDDASDARAFLIDLAAQTHGFTTAELDEHSYFYTGAEARRHLLRVASGLDSQILGEAQILGQVSDALRRSREHSFAGPALTVLFEAAITAGKRARAETAINSHPASISSVAVAMAQNLSGDLRRRRLLVIGLGGMGRLALKALAGRVCPATGSEIGGEIAVANRTFERALLAAAEFGCHAWRWEELDQAMTWADVIFIATTAHQPLLTRSSLQDLLPGRGGRPLVIVDIAVPRNVEPSVASLADVKLLDIDGLQQGVDEGRAGRQAAIPQVEAIIDEEMSALELCLQNLLIRPVIVDLRLKAEAIRVQELARTLRLLGDVDPATLDRLQHFSRALVNKLLHEPTLRLRQQAQQGEAESVMAAVRYLFDLQGADPL